MAIRFLSTIEEWKDFSNWAPYPIELEGETWKSSEHYYQYKKFEKTDPEYALKIKNAPTAREAKILSMENDHYPPYWNDIKVDVLQVAVMKKFESYPHLRDLLLSTGDEELIEANQEDSFWGEGSDGSGKNWMGQILMEIRAYLKTKGQ
jgi:N-glycosidase YbiA